ncbi:SapC family protein [Pelomonas sp. KK5]|uniref:SapC family protein n=1 Tax=Pelomonas sp. KK5 TaxID=1855730 RepID=UPI00097BD938|nr:SapC family protein [Pelomonas sp. KK5]
MSKTLLIYDKLVALHRERHRKLRLKGGEHRFGFARETNSVLLAASELPQACLDYPCVFITTAQGHAMAALVGLRDRENLFVDAQGHWATNHYVPAFIRRYPFVLSENGPHDSQYTVCVDESYAGLNETEGEPLFAEDGSDSAWLKNAQDFLLQFRQQMAASHQFAERLHALGLLVERQINYELQGRPYKLSGFKLIDEQKLLALPPDVVQELFATGWLGLAYASLLSQAQVPRLAARLTAELEAQAAAAAAQIPPVQVVH